MANKIQLKRGLKSRLSTLSAGEPAFATDTREFFIGTGSGNVNMGGSQWYTGTTMSGTITSTTYYYSTCPQVKLGDMYLNTLNGNVYQCTTAGSGSSAKWTYKGNIRGVQGVQGEREDLTDLMRVMAGMAGIKNPEFEFETINQDTHLLLEYIGQTPNTKLTLYAYKANGMPSGTLCGKVECESDNFVEGTKYSLLPLPSDADGFITQVFTDLLTGKTYARDVPLTKNGDVYVLYNNAFNETDWVEQE